MNGSVKMQNFAKKILVGAVEDKDCFLVDIIKS
jgi:hypothetical protein